MFDKIKVDFGSQFLFQRRLFTQLNLSSVLDQRFALAISQFAEGSLKGDITDLFDRICYRFLSEPLWLSDQIRLQKSWEVSNGSMEYQFAISFTGDALFWDCSPDEIHDVLPSRCRYDDWHLPPGETMQRPYGEVFRGKLIMISSQHIEEVDLAPIRELLKQQSLVIECHNKFLVEQLCTMAEASRG
ncbi:hypothetical protein GRI62_10660 [Erythrobacter arachoides]|uniref:Uncharacterized protein n=1 Tax=Aurantiacibacter arachoides TaxID=1850444 RepID=A0A845A3R5_9SPHN|nr:hypothetical protein [Aurantiacibacter arachoides]MXO94062.1 hypothetical protein [Aurantiacibacter arachoides]